MLAGRLLGPQAFELRGVQGDLLSQLCAARDEDGERLQICLSINCLLKADNESKPFLRIAASSVACRRSAWEQIPPSITISHATRKPQSVCGA